MLPPRFRSTTENLIPLLAYFLTFFLLQGWLFGTDRPSSKMRVKLFRDSFDTPWGFRLQGGRDLNQSLVVQRVSVCLQWVLVSIMCLPVSVCVSVPLSPYIVYTCGPVRVRRLLETNWRYALGWLSIIIQHAKLSVRHSLLASFSSSYLPGLTFPPSSGRVSKTFSVCVKSKPTWHIFRTIF